MRNYRVTGPAEVSPQVLAAMAEPMMSHRSDGFRDRLAGVTRRLGPLFGTTGDVLALTCSGTGGLEAAVTSVLRPGDRVLSVQIGYFGERFAAIARHGGAHVDALCAPWGEVVDADELGARAAGYDAVLLTHNETSTGVLAPLREWAAAVRSAGSALLLVDVVSSLAATEVGFDELGLDVAVGVTQKALACPPGLALVATSPRALERARAPEARAYYLGLAAAADAAAERTTVWTPALPQLFALEASLDAIEDEGLPAVWARHAATARRCREVLAEHGLPVVPRPEICSPTVTAVRLPRGDAQAVRSELARSDLWVSSGRGAWKDDVLRIGHMGPVPVGLVEACAAAVAAAVAGRSRQPPPRTAAPSVRVLDEAAGLDAGWDELCTQVDAVLFQQRAFLRAYEANPVQRVTATRYVEVGCGDGLMSAAPLYRQADPLGLLGLAPGQQALLSAMWHCPDTRLLTLDADGVKPLLDAFAAQADELGCPLWGFVNVSADAPAVALLEGRGLHRRDLVPRWQLDSAEHPDGDRYLAGLRRPVRHELRRQRRRAAEYGASTAEHGPEHPRLVDLLELVAATASRAGSPRYYDPQRLAALLRQVGPVCRLLEVTGPDGATLGVGICFRERDRLQYWAAGYVRDQPALTFSPYWVLWWAVLELMWSSEAKVAECGRLNEKFKIRMGLRPRPLVALLSRS